MKRMVIALCLMIVLSIVVTAFSFYRSSHQYPTNVAPMSFRTLLFSLWPIAAAMWQRGFYEQRIPGLFDITVERILFVFVIVTLIAGFLSDSLSRRGKRTFEPLLFLFCIIRIVSMSIYGLGWRTRV
jgi:hypothetical protein